ncbi:MAG: hypothetical protein KatS3mg035_0621 [Bacteroidia bacterium]|nr:MAG: hypothetical protein KatS3mg035_0621 [Bacteroidia bacterium]
MSEQKNRITVRIHDLGLPTIHKVYPIHSQLKGNIDAKIILQNPFEAPLANINGQIEKLNFYNIDYGKLVLVSHWEESTHAISLSLGLIQQNDTIPRAFGIL